MTAVPAGAVGRAPEGDVVRAFLQERAKVLGGLDHHVHRGARDALGEEVQQPAGRVFGEGSGRNDLQPSGVVLGVGNFPAGLVRQPDDVLGVVGQRPAARGQRDAARGPDEQRIAEVLPERRQGRGHCRFADAEGLRGSVQRAQAGDQGERAELAQCHRHGVITFRL